VYQQQQQQEQQQQEQQEEEDAENPFLDPPFSRIKIMPKNAFSQSYRKCLCCPVLLLL
jgi:hypothetical protein